MKPLIKIGETTFDLEVLQSKQPVLVTEAEVGQIVRQQLESLFPKVCQNCSRRYDTLREYMLVTKRVGLPISYDAELGNWKPTQFIGALALANCPCGSTLALSSEGMILSRRLAVLDWMRIETLQQRVTPSELLEHVLGEVRKQVLGEPIEGNDVAS